MIGSYHTSIDRLRNNYGTLSPKYILIINFHGVKIVPSIFSAVKVKNRNASNYWYEKTITNNNLN